MFKVWGVRSGGSRVCDAGVRAQRPQNPFFGFGLGITHKIRWCFWIKRSWCIFYWILFFKERCFSRIRMLENKKLGMILRFSGECVGQIAWELEEVFEWNVMGCFREIDEVSLGWWEFSWTFFHNSFWVMVFWFYLYARQTRFFLLFTPFIRRFPYVVCCVFGLFCAVFFYFRFWSLFGLILGLFSY